MCKSSQAYVFSAGRFILAREICDSTITQPPGLQRRPRYTNREMAKIHSYAAFPDNLQK